MRQLYIGQFHYLLNLQKGVHYVFYTGALTWFCLLCIMVYHAYLSVKVLSLFFGTQWNCLDFFHLNNNTTIILQIV